MATGAANETEGERRRRLLFEIFSRNLQAVKQDPRVRTVPDFDEGFICPICFKLFTRLALSKEYADHLSLEDVPPRSLGGKVSTLTCKVCNNQAGGQLENHLRRKLRADEFFEGIPGVPIETHFEPAPSVDLAAVTQLAGDRSIEVICDPNRSDPGALERFYALPPETAMSSFTLRFLPGYKINRPEVALIRIAYLLAFSQFGYGFLMNANLVRVRQQIQNSEQRLLPSWGLLKSDFPDDAVGMSVMDEPQSLRSFLVVFDLKTEARRTRHGVLLPGPSDPGLGIYDELARLISESGRAEINHRIRVIPSADYLKDPGLAFAAQYYWENDPRNRKRSN
jgi:hypothetical protein